VDQLKPPEGTVTASFADQEIWHVLVASDDMKRMNVEQLDDAFRLDVVDASTLVWKTGMNTWRRLGSLAGLDEEQETVTKQMTAETLAKLMPPPPPPPPRPRSLAPSPPRPAPVAAFQTQQFAAPLVASPMYVPQMPQLYAPDPYALPKRRAKVPSEVDFRRKPGGVRLGRWLVGFLLLTVGVLACYRQNLLREGARRIGIENKYLYGEKRALAFVTAKAPGSVQSVLTRLKLLPGPNAVAAALPAPRAVEPAAPVAAPVEAVKAASAATDSDVKTVSLDSLPVLGADAPTAAAVETKPLAAAPAPRAAVKPVVAASRPAAKRQREEPAERPEPKAKPKAEKVAKAEPKEAPEPKAKPVKAEPPPAGNESFLKAAIRSAIAQDAAKGK
jgi:hypothetical protein